MYQIIAIEFDFQKHIIFRYNSDDKTTTIEYALEYHSSANIITILKIEIGKHKPQKYQLVGPEKQFQKQVRNTKKIIIFENNTKIVTKLDFSKQNNYLG